VKLLILVPPGNGNFIRGFSFEVSRNLQPYVG